MKPSTGFTQKQESVLAALLTEVTMEQAAKKAGVSNTTLWRYLQLPAFRTAYQQARRQIVEESIALLQRASKRAVATLVKNLDSGSPSVEVTSARVILEQSFRGVELLELQERVQMLEDIVEDESRTKA